MSHGCQRGCNEYLVKCLSFTSIFAILLPPILASGVPQFSVLGANRSNPLILPVTDTTSFNASSSSDPSSIDDFLSSSNISSNAHNDIECLDPSQATPPYVIGADCDPIISHLIANLKRMGLLTPRLFIKKQKPPIPLDAFGVYKHWSYGSCFVILDSDFRNDEASLKMIEVIDAANKVVKRCVKGMQKAPLGGRVNVGNTRFFVAVVNTDNAAEQLEMTVKDRGVPFSVGAG